MHEVNLEEWAARNLELQRQATKLARRRTRARIELDEVTPQLEQVMRELLERGFDVTEVAEMTGYSRKALYKKGMSKKRGRAASPADPMATHGGTHEQHCER